MAIGVLALVGTRKGLFLLRGDDDRRCWRLDGPLLDGWGVYHATVDGRDGTIYAAANDVVYGPTVQRSADRCKTWQRSTKIGLPEWSGLTVNAGWDIEPGLPQQPGTLYLGADPGVLFRSDDCGGTWEPNRGILEHPTRDRWFPGAAGCAAIRSSSTPATRNACTSVSPRRARSGLMTADRPGCRSTRMWRSTTFPTQIRKLASACTSCCCIRRSQNGSGSRTTAASTALITAVTPGSGSTETGAERLRVPDHDRSERP